MQISSWQEQRILKTPSIAGYGFLVESQNLRGISIGIDRQGPANFYVKSRYFSPLGIDRDGTA